MKYLGISISGKEIDLGNPIFVKINQSIDAPADDLYAVFCYRGIIEELKYIKVYLNDEVIFDGIMDEQIVEITKTGSFFKIYARSMAALLVDNEALPQTYIDTSLEIIFNRHARPYGFKGFIGQNKKFLSKFIVYKGMSEWEVLEGFCKTFLNTKPRVTCEGTINAGNYIKGKEINLSNYSDGIRYTNLSKNIKRYNRISEIFIKYNKDSSYSIKVSDKDIIDKGVKRKRYIDTTNYILDSKEYARELIDNANKKSSEIVATCIGSVGAEVGTTVTINDISFGKMKDLFISKVKYIMDSNGERTELTMYKGV